MIKVMDWLENHKSEDIERIIQEALVSVDIYRQDDSSKDFDEEVGDKVKVATIEARVDRIRQLLGERKSEMESFIGKLLIGLTTSDNVQKDDEWEIDGERYLLLSYDKYDYKTEVLLERLE